MSHQGALFHAVHDDGDEEDLDEEEAIAAVEAYKVFFKITHTQSAHMSHSHSCHIISLVNLLFLLTDPCLPYATPHSPYISPLHLLCCFPLTDPFSPYVTPHSPYISPTHLYRRSTPRSSPMWSRKRRSGTSSPSTRTASAILDASFVFRLCYVPVRRFS